MSVLDGVNVIAAATINRPDNATGQPQQWAALESDKNADWEALVGPQITKPDGPNICASALTAPMENTIVPSSNMKRCANLKPSILFINGLPSGCKDF